MQPLYEMYDPKTFRPAYDPKSADVFSKPIQAFDDTYGALFRHELDTSQKAWMRVIGEMQQLSARWVARRQEMLRDGALWLDPANAGSPGGLAVAWRRLATNSAHRLIEDMSDQMECALRTATRMREEFENTATDAARKMPAANGARRVHARATVKAKRARKPAAKPPSGTTH